MSTAPIIVAYDGTPNADDAVALSGLLAHVTGAPLALAHVYRTPSQSPREGAGVAEERARARGARALRLGAAHPARAGSSRQRLAAAAARPTVCHRPGARLLPGAQPQRPGGDRRGTR